LDFAVDSVEADGEMPGQGVEHGITDAFFHNPEQLDGQRAPELRASGLAAHSIWQAPSVLASV